MKVNEHLAEQIRSLHAKGLHDVEIARKLGRHRYTVWKYRCTILKLPTHPVRRDIRLKQYRKFCHNHEVGHITHLRWLPVRIKKLLEGKL